MHSFPTLLSMGIQFTLWFLPTHLPADFICPLATALCGEASEQLEAHKEMAIQACRQKSCAEAGHFCFVFDGPIYL